MPRLFTGGDWKSAEMPDTLSNLRGGGPYRRSAWIDPEKINTSTELIGDYRTAWRQRNAAYVSGSIASLRGCLAGFVELWGPQAARVVAFHRAQPALIRVAGF